MPKERLGNEEFPHIVLRPFEYFDEHIMQGLAGVTPGKELYRVSTLVHLPKTATDFVITIQEASMDTERTLRDFLFHQGKKTDLGPIFIEPIHHFVPKTDISGNNKNHPLITACSTIEVTILGGEYKNDAMFAIADNTFAIVRGDRVRKAKEQTYKGLFRKIGEDTIQNKEVLAVNPFCGEDIRNAMILVR